MVLGFLSNTYVHNSVSATCVKGLVLHCHDPVRDALLSHVVHRLRFEHSWFACHLMFSKEVCFMICEHEESKPKLDSRCKCCSMHFIQKCNIFLCS